MMLQGAKVESRRLEGVGMRTRMSFVQFMHISRNSLRVIQRSLPMVVLPQKLRYSLYRPRIC